MLPSEEELCTAASAARGLVVTEPMGTASKPVVGRPVMSILGLTDMMIPPSSGNTSLLAAAAAAAAAAAGDVGALLGAAVAEAAAAGLLTGGVLDVVTAQGLTGTASSCSVGRPVMSILDTTDATMPPTAGFKPCFAGLDAALADGTAVLAVAAAAVMGRDGVGALDAAIGLPLSDGDLSSGTMLFVPLGGPVMATLDLKDATMPPTAGLRP